MKRAVKGGKARKGEVSKRQRDGAEGRPADGSFRPGDGTLDGSGARRAGTRGGDKARCPFRLKMVQGRGWPAQARRHLP